MLRRILLALFVFQYCELVKASTIKATVDKEHVSFDTCGDVYQLIEDLQRRVETVENESQLKRQEQLIEDLQRRVETVENESQLKRQEQLIEDLQKRVEIVENENQQQRQEIMELKSKMRDNDEGPTDRILSEPATDGFKKKNTDKMAIEQTQERLRPRIRQTPTEMTVAFFAILRQYVVHLGKYQNVPFDNVVTNIGNAYDPHIGVFRTPIAGVYVFSTTVVTSSSDTSYYGIAVNGKQMTSMYTNGGDNPNDSDSQTVILQLKQGDDVSIQHLGSDHSLHNDNYSVFSGFMLRQAEDGDSIVG